MRRINLRKRTRGQTALEYALVVGVIAVGLIFIGHKVFGTDGGAAHKLMEKAVGAASGTIDVNQAP